MAEPPWTAVPHPAVRGRSHNVQSNSPGSEGKKKQELVRMDFYLSHQKQRAQDTHGREGTLPKSFPIHEKFHEKGHEEELVSICLDTAT